MASAKIHKFYLKDLARFDYTKLIFEKRKIPDESANAYIDVFYGNPKEIFIIINTQDKNTFNNAFVLWNRNADYRKDPTIEYHRVERKLGISTTYSTDSPLITFFMKFTEYLYKWLISNKVMDPDVSLKSLYGKALSTLNSVVKDKKTGEIKEGRAGFIFTANADSRSLGQKKEFYLTNVVHNLCNGEKKPCTKSESTEWLISKIPITDTVDNRFSGQMAFAIDLWYKRDLESRMVETTYSKATKETWVTNKQFKVSFSVLDILDDENSSNFASRNVFNDDDSDEFEDEYEEP